MHCTWMLDEAKHALIQYAHILYLLLTPIEECPLFRYEYEGVTMSSYGPEESFSFLQLLIGLTHTTASTSDLVPGKALDYGSKNIGLIY